MASSCVAAQGRAVRDVRRIGPSDDRRGLVDDDRRRLRRRGVVRRVRRREGDRKRVAAGPEHRSRGRTVDERPGHIGRGVQLRGAQGRAVRDVRRIGPSDDRRGLQDVDQRRGGGRVVINRVRRREGGGERLVVPGPEHRPRGRTVDEGPGHIGRGVQLRGCLGPRRT